MQTRSDMEAELAIRLMSANNSSNFGATRLTTLIKDAEHWGTSIHFWPMLQRGRIFDTQANSEYYDYPTDFLTDSLSRIYVNVASSYKPTTGFIRYDRKNWEDFRDYVDAPTPSSQNPDSTKHYFADFGRQFFLWPVPTVTGDDNGIVWGNIQSPGLPNSNSTTIFSQWNDSGNEAIVLKAMSVALIRIAPQEAAAAEAKAIQLLGTMYKRVVDNMQKDQRLDHPMFNVFDMFGAQSGMATIGNFGGNVNIVW